MNEFYKTFTRLQRHEHTQNHSIDRRAMKWELLAGIFGWTWITSSLVALVFSGFALFSYAS